MSNKELFKDKYRIQSARLFGYDYAWPGYYFVTICTKNRVNYFGEIIKYKAILSEIGEITKKYWQEIPSHYPFVRLGEFAVMPNHLHGIIIICPAAPVETYNSDNPDGGVETYNHTSLQVRPDFESLPINNFSFTHYRKFASPRKNLSAMIRGYKTTVGKYAVMNKIEFAWQPGFYDHIIKNQQELENIEKYIKDNPYNWQTDRNNPENFRI